MVVSHIVRRSAASTAAVNTAVAVDLPVDSTASTPITSPGGRIQEISATIVNTAAGAAPGGVVYSIRIAGTALLEGPQDFDLGGQNDGTTSTADNLPMHTRFGVDLPLRANQPLTVQVFWNGVDVGTPMAQVELVIQS